MSRHVVVETNLVIRPSLEYPQHNGVSDELPLVRLETHEDVCVRDAGQRSNMLASLPDTASG